MRNADRGLFAVSSILAIGTAFFVFGFRYLPSVDFPQHAAELSAWVNLDDPAYGFAQEFEVNWQTPYLLGYLLARPFVPLLGVMGALKLVVLFAALANVATCAFLLRVVHQDPWLSLLAFPTSFGFSFYFGFINFLLATPLLVLAVTLALCYARNPSVREGSLLVFVLVATFLTHGLMFGVAGLVAFLVHLGETGKVRQTSLRRQWPFVMAALISAPWILRLAKTGAPSRHPEQWALSLERIADLPGNLLSIGHSDRVATGFGALVILVLVMSLGRPASPRARPVLFASALGMYLFFPFQLRGVAFLYERFAALIVPGAILMAGPSMPMLGAFKRRLLVVVLSLAWLRVMIVRTHAFNIEAIDFDRAVADLPPRLRVRPIMGAWMSEAFPGVPVFLHFPAYYQATKGGYLGYSFARYGVDLMRYRPGVDVGMAEDEEWNPQRFDARTEVPRYDCFMVHCEPDVGPYLFQGAPRLVTLTAHIGSWWIYRTAD